jgi:PKD repeat protein
VDAKGLVFVADPVTPSGQYVTLFFVSDFGDQGSLDLTQFTVDNEVPVADAGPDQDVVIDTLCTVSGAGSSDDVVNYTWEVDDGVTTMTFYGESFSYTFTSVGTYDVTLTVVDGALHEASDTAVIEVSADALPVADAGPDQDVDEDALVTFDGSASGDDVDILNYTWTIVDMDVEMYDVAPTYTFAIPGDYTVELVVNDTIGQESAVDSMVVSVHDVTAPVADAGPDPTGVLEGDVVVFNGSGSTDNNEIVSYTWSFYEAVIGDPSVAYDPVSLDGKVIDYVFMTEGDYEVTLTVTDRGGNTDTDIVVVRVGAFNDEPVADAGDDQEVSEGDTVTFDGVGSSDDVAIENFTWTFVYDGETQTLYGEAPEFVFETPGTYIVTLNVTDEEGLSDTDTMYVIVEKKASTFLTEYWWLLAALAAVAVIAVLVVLMRRGKGGSASEADTDEELEEEELPPPNDEDA